MRRSSVVGAVGLAFVGLFWSAVPVSAQTSSSRGLQHRQVPALAMRAGAHCRTADPSGGRIGADRINAFVFKLRVAHKSQATIERALADSFCIVPLAGQGRSLAARTSVYTDITVTAPVISYDTSSHVYYAIANWSWDNKKFVQDCTPTSGNTPCGGPDGFATSFNVGLANRAQSVSYGGGGCYYAAVGTTKTSTINKYGAGFTFPDEVRMSNGVACDNAAVGQQTYTFTGTGKCQSVDAHASYEHTWNTTSTTLAAIGPWSIGWSTTSTSYQWRAESLSSRTVTIC